jgi:hypothetical protein
MASWGIDIIQNRKEMTSKVNAMGNSFARVRTLSAGGRLICLFYNLLASCSRLKINMLQKYNCKNHIYQACIELNAMK